jgi:hypothetical protein
VGPQGPAGADGAVGPQGPAGADGAPGGLAAADYSRVDGTASASNSTTPKTVTAVCPAGSKVLGGGFEYTAGTNGVAVTQSRATADDTWTVTADEINNVPSSWSVQAFAICVTAN